MPESHPGMGRVLQGKGVVCRKKETMGRSRQEVRKSQGIWEVESIRAEACAEVSHYMTRGLTRGEDLRWLAKRAKTVSRRPGRWKKL